MNDLVITGARVVDPANNLDDLRDVYVKGGKIEAVDKPGSFASIAGIEQHKAQGLILTPGLIDIHVHLREPGEEWKETVETGCAAAVAGGFTTVCCMPNTRPNNDSAQVTEYILEKAREANTARVNPIGAITLGRKGESLAPMLELKEAGCVAFSDDGYPVSSSAVMRKACEYSLMLDSVLTVHEEDKGLSEGFAVNESALSLKLGLKGMPGASEDVMIARDIEIARLTGARVHFCHVSTARAVKLIERAKEDGINVTAEVTPHHFTLDESEIENYNTLAKVSMPLRGKLDVETLLDALASGTIDCIASDHAPHEADSKNREFDLASFGLIGLQTTLPLTLAKVRAEKISLLRAISALTVDPARCLKLNIPALSKGKVADIVLIDPEKKFTLEPQVIRSKGKNTPFLGREMQGAAVKTYVGGRLVYQCSEGR